MQMFVGLVVMIQGPMPTRTNSWRHHLEVPGLFSDISDPIRVSDMTRAVYGCGQEWDCINMRIRIEMDLIVTISGLNGQVC